MGISQVQIDQFLTSYAAALTELDAEAGAELWSMPGVIADDRFTVVIETRAAMVTGLKQSYRLYQKLGLGSVTEKLVLAHVHWNFLDTHGDLSTAPPTT